MGAKARKEREHVGALGLLKSADLFSSVYQKRRKKEITQDDACVPLHVVATPSDAKESKIADCKIDGAKAKSGVGEETTHSPSLRDF